jgi:hypothetical protein
MQVLLVFGALVFLLPSLGDATVYGWRGENGVLHLTNNQEEVPEAHRPAAKTFTSRLAMQNPVTAPETAPAPSVAPDTISAYERGLERGLQTAERQVALAGELARTLLVAAQPPPPPAPPQIIIVQQPAPVVRYVSSEPAYAPPYYGYIGPYSTHGFPYNNTYAYGFGRGRLIRHSHFFPGARRRGPGLYFPYGHSRHRGFLFGHGLVVR